MTCNATSDTAAGAGRWTGTFSIAALSGVLDLTSKAVGRADVCGACAAGAGATAASAAAPAAIRLGLRRCIAILLHCISRDRVATTRQRGVCQTHRVTYMHVRILEAVNNAYEASA